MNGSTSIGMTELTLTLTWSVGRSNVLVGITLCMTERMLTFK